MGNEKLSFSFFFLFLFITKSNRFMKETPKKTITQLQWMKIDYALTDNWFCIRNQIRTTKSCLKKNRAIAWEIQWYQLNLHGDIGYCNLESSADTYVIQFTFSHASQYLLESNLFVQRFPLVCLLAFFPRTFHVFLSRIYWIAGLSIEWNTFFV